MSASYVTPPRLANRLAITPEKVLGWIRRGELRAVDVTDKQGGRPRWRISEEAVAEFLAARAAKPDAVPQRRRKKESYHAYV